jgi:hypothetical protein
MIRSKLLVIITVICFIAIDSRSHVHAQVYQVIKQPSPGQTQAPKVKQNLLKPSSPNNTLRPSESENDQESDAPKNRTPARKESGKSAAPTEQVRTVKNKQPKDVFDLGIDEDLSIVEVEPVDFESVMDGEIPYESTPGPSEEFVVGGGGIPTGTYLEDGRWINDGDVITDDSALPPELRAQMSPEYSYGDYSEFGPYGESLEQVHAPAPTGVPVSPFWVRGEALLWTLDGSNVPPLVTSSVTGTSLADAGVLGFSTTRLLLGGEKINDVDRAGARIELGGWSGSRGLGWHAAYFALDDSADNYDFNSANHPILARPFFSLETGSIGQNAEIVSFPGQLDGNISVAMATSLEGAELMAHRMLAGDRSRQIEFTAGYQYNSLEDELNIVDFKSVTGASSGLALGTTLTERDRFETRNTFNGGAVGIRASMQRRRYSLGAGMQLALGNNRSVVRIDGSTTSSVPVTALAREVVTTQGGLLALASNIGEYSTDMFSVIPQLSAELGVDLGSGLRFLVGYRFLYWSQLVRAGEQIDTGVNLSQLDTTGARGELRPRFDLRTGDFWAQGVSLGLDWRY